ncbi:MAG: hypothetical protein MJY82_06720 [Fibrobacter sp.]|nr:hypothetical protein [Fibrobacter sp.]
MIYVFVVLSGLLGGCIALLTDTISNKKHAKKIAQRDHDLHVYNVRIKALAAERFAADNLVRGMQIPGAEGNIRAFGMLLSMLDATIINSAHQLSINETDNFNKIRELMFAYQQLALQCTELATQIRSMHKNPSTCMLASYFQKKLVSNVTQCVNYRKQWNALLSQSN